MGYPRNPLVMQFKRGTHLKLISPGGECAKSFFQHGALGPGPAGKIDPYVGNLHLLGKILRRASLPLC